jgi:hypothetical protein
MPNSDYEVRIYLKGQDPMWGDWSVEGKSVAATVHRADSNLFCISGTDLGTVMRSVADGVRSWEDRTEGPRAS